uniref:Uncharacterized protein n=1 Tax=Sipha flava TaxID=143950 RepID=A0A2S2Q4L6_9HEMI
MTLKISKFIYIRYIVKKKKKKIIINNQNKIKIIRRVSITQNKKKNIMNKNELRKHLCVICNSLLELKKKSNIIVFLATRKKTIIIIIIIIYTAVSVWLCDERRSTSM